ncbi:hypothetical protein ONE63_010612 [Megalurothrips usitatus]|uniref:Uncharacterized protein n=1 Tax=Megalurothrips usitatus TaxID=439358 RepID=A0AAV7XH83_9NEOP|nr:hypothetical protein ONE63_010612 [Megalurothrips usitatus]
MNCKAILAVALAALVALQLASAHPLAKRSCACGLRGTDVCGSPGCIPAAILRPTRPRAPVGVQRVIVQKYAPTEFNPQNICTCEGGLVSSDTTPAAAPPACSRTARLTAASALPPQQAPNYGYVDSCGDEVAANPCEDIEAPAPVKTYVIPAESSLPAEELIEEVPAPAPQAPVAADAVSLAIAYDLATKAQKNVLEEKLAFGHMQTPQDGRVVIKKRIVPESGLYAVRNQIVELKAPTGFGRSCEDEAEASLLAAQQASCGEEESAYGGSLPSYRDLGFAPVNGECKFVPGSYQPQPQVVQTVEYSVPAPAAKASGPAYGPCDALASIERGRGQTGYDYYSQEGAAAAAAGAEEVSSYAGAGLSYGPAPAAPAPARSHTGRPGCSCGCGY